MSTRKLNSALAWAFLLAILSCDGSHPTDPSRRPGEENAGTLTGVVAVDQTHLPGIQVTLTGLTDLSSRSHTTDPDGTYHFEGIPAGTYQVEITGFPSWANFDSSRNTAVVAAGTSATRLDFLGTRRPEATISGWVTVEEMGLPGVVLTLSDSSRTQAISGIDGAFGFQGLDEGPHTVTVSGFDPSVHDFPKPEIHVIAQYGRDFELSFLGTNVSSGDAPPLPTGLRATPTDSTNVALSWSKSVGAETEVRLERKVAGHRTWVHLLSLPANTSSYSDPGLAPHTDYRYRIRACTGSACSGYSNESLATTPGPGDPNLLISGMYLTQGVQTLRGEVPLVAGQDGLLRVFPVSMASNTLSPHVRVRVFAGDIEVFTEDIPATRNSVPLLPEEGDLEASWNLPIPGAFIQPGLTVSAEVDPQNLVSEPDEGDNRFPWDGQPLPLDVRVPPSFDLMFVPIRQRESNLAGDVKAENTDQYLSLSRKLFPVSKENISIHSEYITDSPPLSGDNGNGSWGSILSEINALRVAEGASQNYYGVVRTDYSGGVAGMGYQGWPVAVGKDELPSAASVLAHELGHSWNRGHSPGCAVGGPDPSYPYRNGRIGAWGLDLEIMEVKSPEVYYDLMGYCRPRWISDYTYESILDFREARRDPEITGEAEPSLLLWGRVEGDALILEPAFELTTLPSLPPEPGNYLLEGRDGNGEGLFQISFNLLTVTGEGGTGGHFAFAVPLRTFPLEELDRISLSGNGLLPSSRTATRRPFMAPEAQAPSITRVSDGRFEVRWNPGEHSAAIARDPTTGQILAIARKGTILLASPSQDVEVLFSNGVRTSEVMRSAKR